MAGDWIKFEVSTPDKPEVWQIAEALELDPDAVVGKLLRVWCWFDTQTENGNAPSVTKKLLDREVGVTGFCDCMVSVGWMIENDGIYLPNFDRHNGQSGKSRALGAKRQAARRKSLGAESRKCTDKVTQEPLPEKRRDREEVENRDKDIVKRKRFEPPQINEAESFFAENESTQSEAQKFIDFYESKGWLVGKSKMKDWEAAARNWIRRNKSNPNAQSKDDYYAQIASEVYE